MTREEAIKILMWVFYKIRRVDSENIYDTPPTEEEIKQAGNMAIKALEQEPKDTWSIKDVANTFKKHGLIREQEPCEDAISRQAVLDEIDDTNRRGGFGCKLSYTRCRGHIEQLPPVTQKPKTGHWEKTTDDYCYWYGCSCCGTKAPKNEWGSDYFSLYCPECGAKMVEPQESEE